jgi:hypothetical protein
MRPPQQRLVTILAVIIITTWAYTFWRFLT